MKLYSVLAVLLVAVTATTACAAPNLFGVSGGLEMPNDTILAPGSISLGYHLGLDVAGGDEDVNFFTGTVGIVENLEVGIGVVDSDPGSETIFNAKYRLIAETVDRPAVTIGVVDIGEELEDNPGLFILLSKNLTAAAEDVTGSPSKPLRGHIGFGSGIYKGLLLGLDWTFTPKAQISFEYLSEGLEDGDFNGLLRYALTPEVRLDLGALDFDDLVVGISYTSMKF